MSSLTTLTIFFGAAFLFAAWFLTAQDKKTSYKPQFVIRAINAFGFIANVLGLVST
jgi:hypothetical protein